MRKDLIDEIIEPFIVGVNYNYFTRKKTFLIKYKITGGTPKYVLINHPIFSTIKNENHWTIDNHGDIFFINVQESDSEPCTSTNVTQNATNVSVGGSINFGELVKNPIIPGLTFNISKTTTYTQTLVVNGVTNQDMGNTYFEYCQPFPNFVENSWWYKDNWMQFNTTGAVQLGLYSPWFY